jgi:hypothetical protein
VALVRAFVRQVDKSRPAGDVRRRVRTCLPTSEWRQPRSGSSGLFVEPIPGTPEGIKKRGEAEAALWGSLIRELKIEAD